MRYSPKDDVQEEIIQYHASAAQVAPLHMFDVTLISYTNQNVANRTILSTYTHLGVFADGANIDLTPYIKALSAYEIPKNAPDYLLSMLKAGEGNGQFRLEFHEVDVSNQAYMQQEVQETPVQIIGQDFFHQESGSILH